MPYSLREALNAFRRSPMLASLSIAMIGMSLLVVGLFGIAAWNIRRVIDRIEARVEIVAYLRDSAHPQEVQRAQQALESLGAVRAVTYISREQAMDIAKRELPEFQNLFGAMEGNPLPASFEISLTPGQKSAEAVRAIAQQVARYEFVEDVRYGNDWLDKIYLLRRVAGAATLILGGAFALVAALIIGAAIRIAIFARRDEIAIMRLVGATDGFVRRPFLLEGLITGACGGAVALLLTYVSFRLLSNSLLELEWLPTEWVIAILALGSILGALASSVAVRRHLQEI